jgi:predicted  nucleic acid-binding Zn-ribbon protein
MGSTEIKLWQDEELIEIDRKIDELEGEINSKIRDLRKLIEENTDYEKLKALNKEIKDLEEKRISLIGKFFLTRKRKREEFLSKEN